LNFGYPIKAATLIALAAVPSVTAAQDTAAMDATVKIVDAITLTNTRDMDFGRIIAPGSGLIDMDATDVAQCSPNNAITLLDTCQSAAFEGTAGAMFQIRVSVPPLRRIILTGPGRDLRLRRMAVGEGDGLTFIRRVGRNFDFEITDPNGDFEFFVGGRLLIRNNQEPGVYTGTFDIEVDYQ